MAVQQTGLRKRQQIANANKMMFLWVAGASVVVGAALVIGFFLVNKLRYNESVLAEKQKTSSILSKNLDIINDLKDEVRVLNTNAALKSVMTDDESEPIQVVLDALPSEANSTALGSSLQQKFLNDPELKVQSLTVTPVQGLEQTADTAGAAPEPTNTDGTETVENTIQFNFVVSAQGPDPLKKLLQNLEKSVRTIDITSLTLDVQNEKEFVLTVNGKAFYQPAKTVTLKDKTVKP